MGILAIESRAYSLFFWSVSIGGAVLTVLSAFGAVAVGVPHSWLILASLTALTGQLAIKIPGVNSKISVADTFVFTNLILFGIEAGTLTAVMDGVLSSIRARSSTRRLHYVAFNAGAMAISANVAGRVFFGFMERGPLIHESVVTLKEILLPLASMALVHYLVNSGAVATIVALERREHVYRIWRESFLWTSITYFAGATVSGLIALNATSVTPPVLAVITPIVAIIYFTHRTYFDRLAENRRHLRELSRVYLDTIETLAMAVDAKDQVTHGHVRRVQVYARGLGRAVGIRSENELAGLEAAALLHDIGKLAIPEYILNKPGKLSRTEYQKMMIHPVVGGDILASIKFPYPVAEYVRHHHECWDGSGYPDRLKGTQIPLGARVLAVADCYDALTFDRPYRAGYSREQAMSIIRARVGTYYDPGVVERFDEVLDGLIREVDEIEFRELRIPGLSAIADGARIPERSVPGGSTESCEIRRASSHREVLALWELAQNLGSTLDLHETLLIVASKLEKIVPFTTCVIYLTSTSSNALSAAHVSGANADAFRGHMMEVGENLAGWVSANNHPAVNSDPVFDIAAIKERLAVDLTNALVYPLSFENRRLGVIALYASSEIQYSDDHQRLMDVVARQAAMAIYNAIRFEETQQDTLVDALSSLPKRDHLERCFHEQLRQSTSPQFLSLIVLGLDGFRHLNSRPGDLVEDRCLVEIARILKAHVAEKDVVVRYDGDAFAALLSRGQSGEADFIGRRVQQAFESFRAKLGAAQENAIEISVGTAHYPADGETLPALMRSAYQTMYRDREQRRATRSLSSLQFTTGQTSKESPPAAEGVAGTGPRPIREAAAGMKASSSPSPGTSSDRV